MTKKLSVLLSLLLVIALLVGCTSGTTDAPPTGNGTPDTSTQAPTTSEGNTTPAGNEATGEITDRAVHLSVNAAWQSFDPMSSNAIIMLEVMYNVYEPLIAYMFEDGGSEVPKVAESYEASSDGLTYTFKIRQGVKFHNGETLTAGDAVFSLNRALESGTHKTYLDGVTNIEAPDDATVVVTLGTPRASFIQNIALVPIMNEKFVTEAGDGINTSCCGTGPYKVDSVDLAVGAELSQFADYWGELGPIKSASWDVITDQATQAMALEGGSLDFIRLPHARYAEFEGKDGFSVGAYSTFHGVFVCFNSTKAPFDNQLVRQAMCYLINNDEIAIACFEGLCEPDTILMNRNIAGLPGWDVLKQNDYEYNPEKGLELLRQAGYDTTKEIDLGEIISYAEGHYITKACPIIQANLAQYNIKLEINAMETNAFADRLYAGDYTMAMAGGAWGGDASMYEKIFGSIGLTDKNNFLQWSDPDCDAAFKAGAVELDPVKRAGYYQEAIRIMMEAAPGKSVGHKYETYCWTNDLNPVIRINQFFINDWSWN